MVMLTRPDSGSTRSLKSLFLNNKAGSDEQTRTNGQSQPFLIIGWHWAPIPTFLLLLLLLLLAPSSSFTAPFLSPTTRMLIPICLPLRSCLLVSPHSSQPQTRTPNATRHPQTEKTLPAALLSAPALTPRRTDRRCHPPRHLQTLDGSHPTTSLPIIQTRRKTKRKKRSNDDDIRPRVIVGAWEWAKCEASEDASRTESGDGNDFACRSEEKRGECVRIGRSKRRRRG